MLLAYVDESGNTGEVADGGSLTYTLGCVLLHANDWPSAFDEMLAFRRRIRDTFGPLMRVEMRANDLIRNGGEIRTSQLAPAQRSLIYRAHLRALRALPARAFAIVVDKRIAERDYFDLAWESLLQRLERTSTKEEQPFMVLHDHGENDRVRAWVRRSRRYLTAGRAIGGGGFKLPASLVVDDPVPLVSHQSYFIQLADLVAYAGFRDMIAPGANVAAVCPQAMWGEIGPATHAAVSGLKPRASPGVVVR